MSSNLIIKFLSQFNNKYKNVFYENQEWRLYDETQTDSLDALYSEVQINLITLIKKYNFNLYYFKCLPNTNLDLEINNLNINLELPNVKKIKENQMKDFLYLYENKICNMFYSFIKLNKNNVYYFDFMILVEKDFDLKLIYDHNFNTIKIVNFEKININGITFDWVKNIFSSRINIQNNCSPSDDKNYYNLSKLSYNFNLYKLELEQKNEKFSMEKYDNFNSFFYYGNFNENLYINCCFKLLCSHIWSTSRYHYLEKNKSGLRVTHKDLYKFNVGFLTNFAELMGSSAINYHNNKIIVTPQSYTFSCIFDNLYDQNICHNDLDLNFKESQKLEFKNLKIYDQSFSCE